MGVLLRISKSVSTRLTPRLRQIGYFCHLVGPRSASDCGNAVLPFKNRRTISTSEVGEPEPKTYTLDDFLDERDDCYCYDDSFNASPLVHIFSMDINTNFHDGRPCKLYGRVRVTDGEDGTSYNLYDRNRNKPETIMNQSHKLLLSGLQWSKLPCSLGNNITKLDINLMDRTHNLDLINGQLKLDSNIDVINDSYDELKKAVIEGEHGFATVYYATFRFAVYAKVEVAIFAKYDDMSRPFSQIYGTIVAGYANSKGYKCIDDEKMRSTLFNKSADEFVRVSVGTPISLSRCVVVVPVFSSLTVEAQLWESHNGSFVTGIAEFFSPTSGTTKLIIGEGGSVVVKVTWENAFDLAYKKEEEERENSYDIDASEKPTSQAHMVHDQSLQPPTISRPLTSRHNRLDGSMLVEVLSIFVDSQAKDISAMCGTVEVRDLCDRVNIYDRDLSDPDFCSSDTGFIALQGQPKIDCSSYHFSMFLHLKDPISDLEISKGEILWVLFSPNKGCCVRYDKRICSVIRGAHGYAAMHYVTFENACNAIMKMTFLFAETATTTLLSANIYGCVSARYGSFDYSTAYDNKFYQIRLFDKSKRSSVKLTPLSNQLPLLKSVVAVPFPDRLIVEAKLWATPTYHGNQTGEDVPVFGIAEFKVGDECDVTLCEKIQGETFHMTISADIRDG